ncbi:hypothetical protein CIPAW_10G162100 [Carya illinoinensis]|uniref:Uncharacterized protein n=1 Tax=Carya illinoinensis TaxID=32201 RepID=A0A8T1PE00_CARIL|nr:hypothetical protein CIPAW_10G162100 [Carya illinoinensis]
MGISYVDAHSPLIRTLRRSLVALFAANFAEDRDEDISLIPSCSLRKNIKMYKRSPLPFVDRENSGVKINDSPATTIYILLTAMPLASRSPATTHYLTFISVHSTCSS